MEGAISRVYPLTSISCSKKTREPNTAISTRRRTGPISPSNKTRKLNLEVSPHRAVSAVRLMRIDLGGAFADLLNEKGKGSGDNEMGYVERTLGFCTRELDDRDLRVVTDVVGGSICCKRYLDHLIGSLCHDGKTFRSMEPPLLQWQSQKGIGFSWFRQREASEGGYDGRRRVRDGISLFLRLPPVSSDKMRGWEREEGKMPGSAVLETMDSSCYPPILKIGFYEIVKLDMPPYAVVDENVRQRLPLDLVR